MAFPIPQAAAALGEHQGCLFLSLPQLPEVPGSCSLSKVGSVAAECFVSAPSILWERCLSPLDQGLAQRTGRHF